MKQTDVKLNSRIFGKQINLNFQKAKYKNADEAVLFIHGATFPSQLSSGFQMNGISWADYLSEAGYDVFALDFLGYGKSDRYDYMSDLGNEFVNSCNGKDLVKDIDIATDYIFNKLIYSKIHLIGHSWGATISGYYATVFPDKIDKLILFAPIVQRSGLTSWQKPTTVYTDLSPSERINQFLSHIPDDCEMTLEDEIFTKWGNEWLKSDPSAKERFPHTIRFPSAWEKDLFECWNGNCFFYPSKIKNSTLLIRGEWDIAFNEEEAHKVFSEIKNAPVKRYVLIDKSTHVLHLEKRRFHLYEEVELFLKSK